MNLAIHLFLTAFGTIMGIVILFSVVEKIINRNHKETDK